MHFKPFTLEDIEQFRPFFRHLPAPVCDLTCGIIFMWRDFFHMDYAIEGGHLYTRLFDTDGTVYYNVPLGGRLEDALSLLLESEPLPIHFSTVPRSLLSVFEMAGKECLAEDFRRGYDYVYAAEDLSQMSGKRFHGQRNLISQLSRSHSDIHLEPIDDSNLAETISFFQQTYLVNAESSPAEAAENRAAMEVLTHLDVYHMFGDVLRADGQIIGFAIGEIIEDTMYVHVEKADRNTHGAYQTLVKLFSARHTGGDVIWINREDDMGDSGLCTAKLALHPHHLQDKYMVTLF